MNYRAEVDFRLAKWVIGNLQEQGLISGKETERIWEMLIREMDPPFKNLETVGPRIFEGFQTGRKTAARRKGEDSEHRTKKVFYSGKLMCAECGELYGPQKWHSTTTAEWVWCCPRRNDKEVYCRNLHFYEEELDEILLFFVGRFLVRHHEVAEICARDIRVALRDREHAEITVIVAKRIIAGEDAGLKVTTDDLAIMLKEIRVEKENMVTAELLDGERLTCHVPKYSPCRGWDGSIELVKGKRRKTDD